MYNEITNFQMEVFENVVFTVPDYETTFMFLNSLLMSYPAVNREFPVTVLASLLSGYPRHIVANIVADVMTNARVLTLRNIHLNVKEFDSVMANYPIYKPGELCDLYHNWCRKYTSMGIKRTLQMAEKLKKFKNLPKRKPLK